MVGSRNAAYAEESAEVEVLSANLEKLKSLTRKIQGSLTRLEASGKVVKEAIGPIYSNTQTLQTTNRSMSAICASELGWELTPRHTDIDRIHEAINKIRQPLDAKVREDTIMRAGFVVSDV